MPNNLIALANIATKFYLFFRLWLLSLVWTKGWSNPEHNWYDTGEWASEWNVDKMVRSWFGVCLFFHFLTETNISVFFALINYELKAICFKGHFLSGIFFLRGWLWRCHSSYLQNLCLSCGNGRHTLNKRRSIK